MKIEKLEVAKRMELGEETLKRVIKMGVVCKVCLFAVHQRLGWGAIRDF